MKIKGGKTQQKMAKKRDFCSQTNCSTRLNYAPNNGTDTMAQLSPLASPRATDSAPLKSQRRMEGAAISPGAGFSPPIMLAPGAR
jgi:hypothetical protein